MVGLKKSSGNESSLSSDCTTQPSKKRGPREGRKGKKSSPKGDTGARGQEKEGSSLQQIRLESQDPCKGTGESQGKTKQSEKETTPGLRAVFVFSGTGRRKNEKPKRLVTPGNTKRKKRMTKSAIEPPWGELENWTQGKKRNVKQMMGRLGRKGWQNFREWGGDCWGPITPNGTQDLNPEKNYKPVP